MFLSTGTESIVFPMRRMNCCTKCGTSKGGLQRAHEATARDSGIRSAGSKDRDGICSPGPWPPSPGWWRRSSGWGAKLTTNCPARLLHVLVEERSVALVAFRYGPWSQRQLFLLSLPLPASPCRSLMGRRGRQVSPVRVMTPKRDGPELVLTLILAVPLVRARAVVPL